MVGLAHPFLRRERSSGAAERHTAPIRALDEHLQPLPTTVADSFSLPFGRPRRLAALGRAYLLLPPLLHRRRRRQLVPTAAENSRSLVHDVQLAPLLGLVSPSPRSPSTLRTALWPSGALVPLSPRLCTCATSSADSPHTLLAGSPRPHPPSGLGPCRPQPPPPPPPRPRRRAHPLRPLSPRPRPRARPTCRSSPTRPRPPAPRASSSRAHSLRAQRRARRAPTRPARARAAAVAPQGAVASKLGARRRASAWASTSPT